MAPDPAAPSTPTPTHDDRDSSRWAYLLDQIANAPGGKLSDGEANKKLPRSVEKELAMSKADANRLRHALVERGYLRVDKAGRKRTYSLTDAGRQHLDAIRDRIPRPNVRGGRENAPANDGVRQARVVYLLLQLFKVPQRTLRQADANKFNTKLTKEALELNAPTAMKVRHELAAAGYIQIAREGHGERYTLTKSGQDRLGASIDGFKALGNHEIKLSAQALGQLLEAARDVAKGFEPATQPAPQAAAPSSPEVLGRVVADVFEELRRERHSASGLVPIHEVRQEIRKRLGEQAASHQVLDDVLLRLTRGGPLRLAPITDHSRATLEELNASIPGMGEILFYIEGAHELAVR